MTTEEKGRRVDRSKVEDERQYVVGPARVPNPLPLH